MSKEDRELHLVWFKRDLRLSDHRPLREAAGRGQVICLYVFEPEICASPEFDGSHFDFICASLRELRAGLRARGGELLIRVGRVPDVFSALLNQYRFTDLWSHEETGNEITFKRDRRVARWAREQGVRWCQVPQNGVVRPLACRDGWSRRWQARMNESPVEVPARVISPRGLSGGEFPSKEDVGCATGCKEAVQLGGEALAHETLQSFLGSRGVGYRKEMSSPLTAEESCSRLSPYLAWGNISVREVYRETRQRVQALRSEKEGGGKIDSRWLRSLGSFEGRLRWHCHFMQKFEDEPSLEFHNMNRSYDGLRETEFDEGRFEAWCRGETGYPMVDACMKALHKTGWINFRMRAMLVSFASYHLWLHWRRPAVFLARHFLDFEPGIHFSQFQMQSGVTGINTLRIYSPAKQVVDQDPKGEFLRRYLPALEGVPDVYLPEPHKMPRSVQREAGCVIGRDYPIPVVDHREAYGLARKRMGEIRRRPEVREESSRVLGKHGSRKRRGRARK